MEIATQNPEKLPADFFNMDGAVLHVSVDQNFGIEDYCKIITQKLEQVLVNLYVVSENEGSFNKLEYDEEFLGLVQFSIKDDL